MFHFCPVYAAVGGPVEAIGCAQIDSFRSSGIDGDNINEGVIGNTIIGG